MKTGLIWLGLLIWILILLGQVDDELSPEAVSLIDMINRDIESDAYLYLLGIFSSESESPIEVGRELLDQYLKKQEDPSFEITEYSEFKKIELPIRGVCSGEDEQCLKEKFSCNTDIDELTQQNALLLHRVNTFLQFDEFTTLTKPALDEFIPDYRYIIAAQQIKILEAIALYKNGQAEQAANALTHQFSRLRDSLELQDRLIGKVVFLAQLSEILDVLSVILSNEEKQSKLIEGLDRNSESFEMMFTREFALAHNSSLMLDRDPNFYDMDKNAPKWAVRLAFKPNMTTNAFASAYLRLIKLTKLSASDFAKEIESNANHAGYSLSLRNYAGSILTQIASPDFDRYIARFIDFEAKLIIFSHLHYYQKNLDELKNPYYPSAGPVMSGDNVCFTGPLEDRRNYRCLRISI